MSRDGTGDDAWRLIRGVEVDLEPVATWLLTWRGLDIDEEPALATIASEPVCPRGAPRKRDGDDATWGAELQTA